ncbi:MAG: hypothetical protein ACYC6L_01460 [Anaerolineae bacterium]
MVAKQIIPMVLSVLIAAGTMLAGCVPDPESERTRAERAIYPLAVDAALAEYYPGVSFLIQSTTVAEQNCIQVNRLYDMLEACRNLLPANKTSIDLSLLYKDDYNFYPEERFAELFNSDAYYWNFYTSEYGAYQGYMRVSRPGLNEELSEAILYIEIRCGALCGKGILVYLVRTGKSWEAVGTQIVWMS